MFILLTQSHAEDQNPVQETVYDFTEIEHPIQPIPTLKSVNKELVLLGKALFNSPLLSKDNTISCASCHMPNFGGEDGFPVSTGVNSLKGSRNSPTVLNSVFNFKQFWDGRAATLAEQVSGPIHNPVEMGTDWNSIVNKLSQDSYFSGAFKQMNNKEITAENIIRAITAFEETLITPNAPIDKYILGDKTALSQQQVRGLELFMDYGCTTCHQGINIGGNLFQKFGRISDIPKNLLTDLGRYDITGDDYDKNVFKVPSLRNITQTGPYFHDGSIATLEEAVTIMARSQLGRELSPSELADIVALLHAFSGELVEIL